VAHVFSDMRSYFAAAIRDAVQAGDVPPVEPERASFAVLAHMEGLLLVAKAANDPDLIARFGENVRAMLGASPPPVALSPAEESP
jgi:hypothetical protein